jgi:hypothetical protein
MVTNAPHLLRRSVKGMIYKKYRDGRNRFTIYYSTIKDRSQLISGRSYIVVYHFVRRYLPTIINY